MNINNVRYSSKLNSNWICPSCAQRSSAFKQPIRPLTSTRLRAASTTGTKSRIPDAPTRTRFAPSPTGNLHLGSIRTALFNYLLARRTGGQFLLRIEDTDQKRTVYGAEERLYQDLRWAGLNWDEGPQIGGPYGPYRQSERLEIYQEHIKDLLDTQKAYRCFCSTDRIDQLSRRRHEKGLPLGYDRKCIDIPLEDAQHRAHRGEAHVIRFRAPAQYPKYKDLVYGNTGHGQGRFKQRYMDEPVFDDPILLKSDGFPTYHFANVVDDKLMHISHIIRGSEWMSSTPLHIALYEAFGWQPPQFGHVPLLVDQNKQKLSKRNLDSDIASFRDKLAIFPDALNNFAVLLGWSHSHESDVLTLAELENIFDLRITKGNAMVNMQKLDFLQEKHARRMIDEKGEPFEQIIRNVAQQLLQQYGAHRVADVIGSKLLHDVIAECLAIEKLHYHNAKQYAEQLGIFFSAETLKKRSEIGKVLTDPQLAADFSVILRTLLCIPAEQWSAAVLQDHLANVDLSSSKLLHDASAQRKKQAKSQLFGLLRWAILGGVAGPDIPRAMAILGREACELRLREASDALRQLQLASTEPEILLSKRSNNARSWQAHTLRSAASTAIAAA